MIASKVRTMRGGQSRALPPPQNTQRLTAVNIPEEAPSISVLDESSPYSLINLVPAAFADRMRHIPKEYFSYSESRLHDEVRPDDTLNKLKLRFWDEWQTSILAGITARVSITAVYYGVCTEEYFYENVLTSPKNMAWVLIPPTDYILTMRDILRQGLSRLSEIIQLPIMLEEPIIVKGVPLRDDDGKLMKKRVVQKGVISEIRQIVQLLSDRVHGAVVQRLDVQQKSLTMEVSPETAHLLATAQSGGSSFLNPHNASNASNQYLTEGGQPITIEATDIMSGFGNGDLAGIEQQLRQLNAVLSSVEVAKDTDEDESQLPPDPSDPANDEVIDV